MNAVITCLSEATLGAPITTTRPYALVPVINIPVVQHQIAALKGYKVTVVTNNEQLMAYCKDAKIACLHVEDKDLEKVLPSASLIVPGDILFEKPVETGKPTILTTHDGSEEEEAVKAVLVTLGQEPLREQIDALRVNYPWEILNANQALIKKIKKHVDKSVQIEENVTINGDVVIGKGTIIKGNSYLEGPLVIGENCTIGPLAHIRPDTAIGDKCHIGKTEVYDCVIMQGTVSKHHAYLGHSVLGEDVNVGAFTVTADYRHDAQEHTTLVKGEKVKTGRRKVGAFIGDHARLAVSSFFYPGRKLPKQGTTVPGEVIEKDRG